MTEDQNDDKNYLGATTPDIEGDHYINNESFLNGISRIGSELVAVIDPVNNKTCYVNEAVEVFLGYSKKEILAQNLLLRQFQSFSQYQRLLSQVNEANANSDAVNDYVNYKLTDKNGKITIYRMYIFPFNDGDTIDKKLYKLLLVPDTSKLVVPFMSNETRELFLEQFYDIGIGSFERIYEPDRLFLSDSMYKLLEIDYQLPENEVDFFRRFMYPGDAEMVERSFEEAIRSGVTIKIEFRVITAKKNIKILECLLMPKRSEEGKLLKYIGSVRDITKERKIEEDLERKIQELNLSNKELEEFAYVASHDMQEPLRKITTFISRLGNKYKGALADEGAMYIDRIVASAENMRTLINDLLEFSRISNTQQPFSPVDLNNILSHVKTELELVIEESKTMIVCDVLPEIEAIPSQMKQLFLNIITNAIKFRKPGVEPVITIRRSSPAAQELLRYNLSAGTPYVKIEYSDNGIGFEEEYAQKIFQVFQRLHGKSEYPGSGIGLAICKKILEHHHGVIFAASDNASGACITCIIPQHQTETKLALV